MKFKELGQPRIVAIACCILAILFGIYFIQQSDQRTFAQQGFDYAVTTMISNSVTTGATTIMHFFSNQTDATDHNVTITSELPDTIDVINTVPAISSTEASGDTIVYYFELTGSEGSVVIDVQGQTGAYGFMRNAVTIDIDEADPILNNNSYASSFVILQDMDAQADIDIVSEGVSTPEGTDVGDTVIFSFRARNSGPDVAYAVIAQYTLDAGLFVSDSLPTPIFQEANLIQWELDQLLPGESADFEITANILESVSDEEELTNQIEVSSPIDDPNTNNNRDTTSLVVSNDASPINIAVSADTSICLNQSGHVLIEYINIDDQDHYLALAIHKPDGVSIGGFIPEPDTILSDTYGRQPGLLNSMDQGSIEFDIVPTSIGEQSIVVQALDDEEQLWEVETISFSGIACSSADIPTPDDDNGNNGLRVLGSNHSSAYLDLTGLETHATGLDTVDASMYTCAEDTASGYVFAYNNNLTSMETVKKFRPCDKITRIESAKILANYAIRMLGKKPDYTRSCVFQDMKNATSEYKFYAKLICELGIMGLKSDGSPDTIFNPGKTITRAELGTAISRQIYGGKYNTSDSGHWFLGHLMALKRDGIIKTIENPSTAQLRSWVIIMLMRVATNPNISINQK